MRATYVASWQRTLRRLKLRPLNADKPQYVALSAMAAPTSPFKQLLESVRDETQLTKERPRGEEARRRRRDQRRCRWRSAPAMRSSRLGTNLPLSAPGVDARAGRRQRRGARRRYREPVQAVPRPRRGRSRAPAGRPAPADLRRDQPEPRHRRDQSGAIGRGERGARAADRGPARQLLALSRALRRHDHLRRSTISRATPPARPSPCCARRWATRSPASAPRS